MAISAKVLDNLLSGIKRKEASKAPIVSDFELDDDGEEYRPIGPEGILAATEKILAVNRGLVPPDERDSLQFKKVNRLHGLLRERIKMDAGKLIRGIMYKASYRKNLQGMPPIPFDGYVEGQLIGNPLTAPLEEINPMQLVEQARRITQMGPGGLGSSRSITEDAQAVHPSQYGFISTLESPESEKAGIDTRVAWGAKLGSNGRIYQMYKDRKTGRNKWMSPEDLVGAVVKIPD